MSKGYTVDDARKEIGLSKDWLLGLEVSIKKWEQIVGGNLGDYDIADCCGLCYIAMNHEDIRMCQTCKDAFPAMKHLCDRGNYVEDIEPKRMLAYMRSSLTRLRKKKEPPDVSK